MNGKIRIVYDKQCPACSAYCDLAQANAKPGQIELVDAREQSELMTEITRRGLDIDEGMVVELEGMLHYGADGIHRLAKATSKTTVFNRMSRVLFKHKRIAHLLYPLLKMIRNLLLKLMGVARINNLKQAGKDKF